MADGPQNFPATEILASLRRLAVDLGTMRADIQAVAERSILRPSSSASAGYGGRAVTGEADEAQRVVAELEREKVVRAQIIEQQLQQVRLEAEQGTYASRRASRPAAAATEAAAVVPVPGAQPAAAASRTAAVAATEESAAIDTLRAQHVAYQNATRTSSVLTGEFVKRLLAGQVGAREFGTELAVAGGKYASFTAAAAGIGVVIGATAELYKGAKDSASGVEQLKRSIDNLDEAKAATAFRDLSTEFNVPIKEASDAIFNFSRVFPKLDDAVAAARVSLSALKVDNVTTADSTRALTSLHQQFGLSAQQLAGYFDLLDEGQRRYNARVQDSIQLTQKATAAYKLAGGTSTGLAQFAVYSERVTNLPGNQIGTALYRAVTNTALQPANQAIIKQLGLDPTLISTNIDEFLNQAIRLAATKGPDFQRKLAIAFGGKQQGGKVFAPIFAANDIPLYESIQKNITPAGSAGATGRELGDILQRPDEILHSIGNQLQNLGSNLAQSHLLDIFALLLATLKQVLVTTNQLASVFNSIPDPFRAVIANAGALLAVLALLRKAGVGGITNVLPGASAAERSVNKQAAGLVDDQLGASRAARGSVIAKQIELQAEAEINRAQAQITADVVERNALLTRAEAAQGQALSLGRRQIVIEEQIAALQEQRAGILSGEIAISADIAAQQARLNATTAGAGAVGRTGFLAGVPVSGAAAKEGIAAGLKGALGGAFSAAIIASIALPLIQQLLPPGQVTSFIGKNTGGLTAVAAGAGAGAAIGGPGGALLGGGLAAAVAFGKQLGQAAAGSGPAPGSSPGFQKAQGDLFDALEAQTQRLVRAGGGDTKGIQDLHDRLQALIKDPDYAGLATNLTQLDAILGKFAKTAKISFQDFTTASKEAAQLADKAKVASTVGGVENRYDSAISVLQKSRISPAEQAKGITDAQKQYAIQQQRQAELAGVTTILDASTGLANAQTQDKSQQLRNTLAEDNQKLALALKLFGRNSVEYKQALAESLNEQQAVVQQRLTDIAAAGALTTSQIGGSGPEADISRARSSLATLNQQLATAQAGGADPNTILGLRTQINDANRALAASVQTQANAMRDAVISLREARTLDPVKQAQDELEKATGDLQGLTGVQRTQQLATVAQKRAALTQAQVTEDLSRLSYESHIHKISDNAYIAGLQEILRTKKLSTDQRRQVLTQIYDLQNQASNSSSGLSLNVGQIKLPTIYEIRRAIAGGQGASSAATVINNSPTISVMVAKQSDVAHVVDAIDKTLGTTARSSARALGVL